jgi:hypothetical protein
MALLRGGHRAPREILSEKRGDPGRKQKERSGSDKATFRPTNESPAEHAPSLEREFLE